MTLIKLLGILFVKPFYSKNMTKNINLPTPIQNYNSR